MTRLKLATVFAIGALSYAISGSFANADEERREHSRVEADAIFFNGKVITLEDVEQRKHKTKIVRAFAVKDGRYLAVGRSEERRVGKECRSRGAPSREKRKEHSMM